MNHDQRTDRNSLRTPRTHRAGRIVAALALAAIATATAAGTASAATAPADAFAAATVQPADTWWDSAGPGTA